MKKTALVLLTALSFLLLVVRFILPPAVESLNLKGRAGLKISSTPSVQVFLDGVEVGKTPYQNENLEVKEYSVKLVGEKGLWQGKIKLNKGTWSIVNREIAGEAASSSGEILSLEKGKEVMVVSNPVGAEVEVDGQVVGKTPLKIKDLAIGEHTFILAHEGYLKRSIRVSLPEKMHLKLDVDLAISEMEIVETPKPTEVIVEKVVVGRTPNGFLRVRNRPTTTGAEVGRVTDGVELEILQEVSGWYKVKMEDGVVGYVSASYVRKK